MPVWAESGKCKYPESDKKSEACFSFANRVLSPQVNDVGFSA